MPPAGGGYAELQPPRVDESVDLDSGTPRQEFNLLLRPPPAPDTAPDAATPPTPPLTASQRYTKSALYGLMNGVMAVPVAVAFTSTIFRDPLFHADPTVFPTLIKLVLFSCFVHQCAFSACSSLPFALGQVQDAGLIFLSTMASKIARDTTHFGTDVHECRDVAADAGCQERLSTVLVSLSCSTALLGLALIVTGKLRLAQYVQYLPLPVVGGYMAFIGLFCGEAGLSLMTGQHIQGLLSVTRGVEQWQRLLTEEAALMLAPGVICGVLLTVVTARFHHYLVLPGEPSRYRRHLGCILLKTFFCPLESRVLTLGFGQGACSQCLSSSTRCSLLWV